MREYTYEAPFDPSLMVHFRIRFVMNEINAINEKIFKAGRKDKDDPPPTGGNGRKGKQKSKNKGRLIIDATCAPADIRYPTDLGFLNEAREKTEKMIDRIFEQQRGTVKKPTTYRRKARKQYLVVAKSRKAKKQQIRKAIGQQLRFINRNLGHIEKLKSKASLMAKEDKILAVIKKLYRQQKQMYEQKNHSVADRIVSISQPHVHPIVRGKVKTPTEFGAKLSISLIDGHAFLDKLEWDNYNEGTLLIHSVELYHDRLGYYQASVHVDAIYRNRENLAYCKTQGIRISIPKLGRPPKVVLAKEKKLFRQDALNRLAVEGKFGEGKRCYSLGLIMAKLPKTNEPVTAMQFLVMNLVHRLQLILPYFQRTLLLFKKQYFLDYQPG